MPKKIKITEPSVCHDCCGIEVDETKINNVKGPIYLAIGALLGTPLWIFDTLIKIPVAFVTGFILATLISKPLFAHFVLLAYWILYIIGYKMLMGGLTIMHPDKKSHKHKKKGPTANSIYSNVFTYAQGMISAIGSFFNSPRCLIFIFYSGMIIILGYYHILRYPF